MERDTDTWTRHERKHTMKKLLVTAFVTCLLALAGCGLATGRSTSSNVPASQETTMVAPANSQVVCHALHTQEVQLEQQIQTANALLAAADGDENAIGRAVHVLTRLHGALAQAQADAPAC